MRRLARVLLPLALAISFAGIVAHANVPWTSSSAATLAADVYNSMNLREYGSLANILKHAQHHMLAILAIFMIFHYVWVAIPELRHIAARAARRSKTFGDRFISSLKLGAELGFRLAVPVLFYAIAYGFGSEHTSSVASLTT